MGTQALSAAWQLVFSTQKGKSRIVAQCVVQIDQHWAFYNIFYTVLHRSLALDSNTVHECLQLNSKCSVLEHCHFPACSRSLPHHSLMVTGMGVCAPGCLRSSIARHRKWRGWSGKSSRAVKPGWPGCTCSTGRAIISHWIYSGFRVDGTSGPPTLMVYVDPDLKGHLGVSGGLCHLL